MTEGTRTIVFELHDYWHAGSGHGGGPVQDAVVARTAGGLPFLSGRTVKGLVREAFRLGELAGFTTAEEAREFLGSSPDDELDRFETRPGRLRFGDATLGEDFEQWALAMQGQESWRASLEPLFAVVASTALDDDGLAKNETLRAVEVAVPVTLRGTVDERPDLRIEAGTAWAPLLDRVLPFVRGLGCGRRRGLGRVSAYLAGEVGA